MRVNEFLERTAERSPGKTALVCGERRWAYAEVEEAANRVAHALRERGVEPGDRVLVYLPNGFEAVIAIFAILKAGGIFVPVNPTTKYGRLRYLLDHAEARALFAPARRAEMVSRLTVECPSVAFAVLCGAGADAATGSGPLFAFDALLRTSPSTRPSHVVTEDDLACLIYTSGSTGDPKGVMSAHANVDFASSSIIQYLENTPDDVVINVLPLSFDYGLYQLLMVFKFGGTLVLERSFAYPTVVLRRIETERVTGLPGVPTLFAMLLRMDLGRFDLTSLRYVTNTGAALPVAHIRRLREVLPWARLFSMYGLTECKRALYLPPEELDRRPESVGVPIPGTEAWVEDEAGNRLGPRQVGELVVRGRHVMRGYWRDPEATAARFRPGRFPGEGVLYTGDLFWMDEEGFFYFVSRKDDIIKSRGEKVAPKEVEDVLYRLPGVAEAAVVGVPDELLGQAVKAYIVRAEGASLTAADVIRHCRAHLEDYKVPRCVEFRESLPKTSSGKIDRRRLHASKTSEG